jgi:hypothetical protein
MIFDEKALIRRIVELFPQVVFVMKFNAFILFILITQIVLNSACWSAKEVTATRPRANDDSPTTTATPVSTSKNSSMENKTTATPSTATPDAKPKTGGFRASLPPNFQMPTDEVGLKLLSEYGSMCVAAGGATAPDKIFFRDEADVSAFQSRLAKSSENIGGFNVELQSAAMDALKKAIAEARAAGKNITPRNADAAKRSYRQTVENWASRVNPGLDYWVSKGKITSSDAARIKALAPSEQVPEILKLEARGVYFSKDFSKSILYSVAAPGSSQHIFMLALDVEQYADKSVREILAKNGWFQTIQSDLPHFTYLGVSESELTAKGLKPVEVSGQKFWIPNI